MTPTQFSKPHGTIVLAMSADGKIADVRREPARFGSAADKAHLEKQIAIADGVLFGAGTLRAYGTTMPITNPELLQQRESDGKPPQPVQILVSQSGNIDSSFRFFQQPVPRWLLNIGMALWICPSSPIVQDLSLKRLSLRKWGIKGLIGWKLSIS